MSIVVFEDVDSKFDAVLQALEERGVHQRDVKRVQTTAEFAALGKSDVSLCIIDIVMPTVKGGQARNVGLEILEMLDHSGRAKIPVLAITAYADEFESLRDTFSARGCIIYDFEAKSLWAKALDIYLAQINEKDRYKFIIFTALAMERSAFLSLPNFNPTSLIRFGIDHWDVEIAGAFGTIVLLPRMGLVTAAATVSRVLEKYDPKIVAMSGICAGVGEAPLGQLLAADICWEYQSGKWYDEAFEAEPYQVNMKPRTRIHIAKMLENPTLLSELEAGYGGEFRPQRRVPPKLAVFTSGSAVIASEKRLANVKAQHRKVSGLDMEMFGFYSAVDLSGSGAQFVGAKVVVDKADSHKDDKLHEYGSFLSAKFITMAVMELLAS